MQVEDSSGEPHQTPLDAQEESSLQNEGESLLVPLEASDESNSPLPSHSPEADHPNAQQVPQQVERKPEDASIPAALPVGSEERAAENQRPAEMLFPSSTIRAQRPHELLGLRERLMADRASARKSDEASASAADLFSHHLGAEDAPWPGMGTERKEQEGESIPWPSLDVSYHSTAEAEAVVFRSGSGTPAQQASPRWQGGDIDDAMGSPSPDSPLSFSKSSPPKARRSKRGRGRTYFNSSRSISSQDSSPQAHAVAAVSSPFSHSLHTFVRSPRWADQQQHSFGMGQPPPPSGSAKPRSAAHPSPTVQSSLGSVAGIHGSTSDGMNPFVSIGLPPAQTQLQQQKAAATASWVAHGAAFGSKARPLPSPFASVPPLGNPAAGDLAATRTHTADSSSHSHAPGRFGRSRTFSAPERRAGVDQIKVASQSTTSPTKSGAAGSPAMAGTAQAAWAALGSDSPNKHLGNSPHNAFLR